MTHYVPTTQPEQPHDKEGGGGGVDGVRLLPDAAKKAKHLPFNRTHFSPCPSPSYRRG